MIISFMAYLDTQQVKQHVQVAPARELSDSQVLSCFSKPFGDEVEEGEDKLFGDLKRGVWGVMKVLLGMPTSRTSECLSVSPSSALHSGCPLMHIPGGSRQWFQHLGPCHTGDKVFQAPGFRLVQI